MYLTQKKYGIFKIEVQLQSKSKVQSIGCRLPLNQTEKCINFILNRSCYVRKQNSISSALSNITVIISHPFCALCFVRSRKFPNHSASIQFATVQFKTLTLLCKMTGFVVIYDHKSSVKRVALCLSVLEQTPVIWNLNKYRILISFQNISVMKTVLEICYLADKHKSMLQIYIFRQREY